MGNFTFKILLLLPLYVLLGEILIHLYYKYFDFSFVVQVLLFLLWGVEVWWVLKTKKLPIPVLVSGFVVFYLAYIIDSSPSSKTYLGALWTVLYPYLLREYYLKSLNDDTAGTHEAGFSGGS